MKNFKTYIVLFACLLMSLNASAAQVCRYRVYLTDKARTTFSLNHPEEYLSMRSIERRTRQGIAIDSTDLPVCRAYIDDLETIGGRCVLTSRWNNTVLMETDSEETVAHYEQLPFVRAVREVWMKPDSVTPPAVDREKQLLDKLIRKQDIYGAASDQIRLHQGEKLHEAGFRGAGMQIAVIDAGFLNVDLIKLFKKTQILGTRDFVNPHSDIYAEHSHGLKVLSCMGVNRPKVMMGTAPEAGYWLLRSEDNDTEQLSEEDSWTAAIEFADSVGVDVVNSSLGYYEFDNGIDNYRYRDLDGRTAMISRSAHLASRKGILVVCSAGNGGSGEWKKITPPADAEGVLTVGAVSTEGINATFSAVGNTADGRVKPDIMSVGFQTAVVGENGIPSSAHGTSFSAPVFCGLATCLWQACPWLTVDQLIEVIHRSGNRSEYPDNIFGYGIPDVWKAYQLAQQEKPASASN